jgi:DNA-directed RNA polymerase alpha subunit
MDNVNVKQMLLMFSNDQLDDMIKMCQSIIGSRRDHTLISELYFSNRITNAIKLIEAEGVEMKYLTQLARYGKRNLLQSGRLGKKSIDEIKEVMYDKGVRLAG